MSSPDCSISCPAPGTDLGEKEGPMSLPAQDSELHSSFLTGWQQQAAPGGGGSPGGSGAAGELSHQAVYIRKSPRLGQPWFPCMHETRSGGEVQAERAHIPTGQLLPCLRAPQEVRAQMGRDCSPLNIKRCHVIISMGVILVYLHFIPCKSRVYERT